MHKGQVVYVLETCLTQGVRHGEVLSIHPHSLVVRVFSQGIWPEVVTAMPMGDCREHPEAAVARAEELRRQKIASLKRQIEKLEALKFE